MSYSALFNRRELRAARPLPAILRAHKYIIAGIHPGEPAEPQIGCAGANARVCLRGNLFANPHAHKELFRKKRALKFMVAALIEIDGELHFKTAVKGGYFKYIAGAIISRSICGWL